jgi:hypothetical protein
MSEDTLQSDMLPTSIAEDEVELAKKIAGERPVKLHFFDPKMCSKFIKVCDSLGIKAQQSHDADCAVWEFWVTTEPLKSTQRRTLISKWASASMERIG